MYVVVAGGGKIGFNLTRTLLDGGQEVLLIEKDLRRFRWLEDHLGQVVLHGDATEVATLEEAGVKRADVVAAVTGFDEDNIMICRLAQKVFGVKRVIGRVNNPQNEDAFRLLGINNIINSTRLIYSLILQEVDASGLIPLLTLKGGKVEFVETVLLPESPAANTAVKDLILPDQCLLMAILREEELIFPRGDVVLLPGDRVIAAARDDEVEALRRSLLGSA
ncbi:potassium channel family protein [Neomoorella thermoacetica]|uniref:Trk system potassium uptake protein TrkA n=2 Tax=Neomoorella thermoacetica TaxID=1525 RepID=A0A1D7XAZ5_NEOTH|nr:NAD-binding protein [Moorella thermoacetica]AKX94127.1 Trk system potassium uptake protein TrkA [Moorella thermoacetica]AKX96766.1 Trk system potassium uptake protein TrkA [Moorella thermoacetica]AOQ24079.1 Trk system potassium uptake protein TrkA [Moorella thermoacetica]APC08519.1 Trk system potassium uptake protein TrkA [Moorella thermoacetica]OIQ08500.1 Trk system potassium uptake protein TrkA [Moorella thermoacetica]